MSQYDRILKALRKAGQKGLTTRELANAVLSNCIHKRVREMPVWHMIDNKRYYIDTGGVRLINSRHVRVYRLREV